MPWFDASVSFAAKVWLAVVVTTFADTLELTVEFVYDVKHLLLEVKCVVAFFSACATKRGAVTLTVNVGVVEFFDLTEVVVALTEVTTAADVVTSDFWTEVVTTVCETATPFPATFFV